VKSADIQSQMSSMRLGMQETNPDSGPRVSVPDCVCSVQCFLVGMKDHILSSLVLVARPKDELRKQFPKICSQHARIHEP